MRRWVLLLALVFCVATPARAGDEIAAGEALRVVATGNLESMEPAIGTIARSGVAWAEPVLRALLEGRLLVRPNDRAVFLRTAEGDLLEATSGRAAEVEARSLRPIRINNRLRRVLEGALGALTLAHPDPAVRLAAAEKLFARPDPSALEPLERSLAGETERRVREAFARARAAILLEHGDPPARARAAEILADDPSPAVLGKLRAARRALPAEVDPAVLAALDAAIARVEGRLRLLELVQTLFQGASLGSVLLLAAIGLAVTFGVMGVINMAHGEMVMIGAYATWAVQQAFKSFAPGALDWSLVVALPAAFLAAGAVGLAIERGVISRLYGRPLETLLATFGISLVLQQAVRLGIGATNREVGTPSWMSGAWEPVPGLVLTANRIVIVLFAVGVFLLLLGLVHATRLGLEIRAVTQNRKMAETMGIRTPRVDALTFALGSGIAGIGGVALSQIDNVSPNLGQAYIVDSFIVVVFGGVGNLWGTFLGAMILGIVNKVLEPLAGAVLGKILVLLALILFIQRRPQGLFALRGRAAEA
ncbi:MAG: urea ABC transporter permease subunit UrtB [Geminicoccaceae bacterium]|nr:urea ABC transporter permease subunit UrtB [Geminicoccaceae bacterium]MCS7266997.1 urea ABC transporter permease subunit UrtB [Geminicoccaceae bacterium]MCX7628776.1 urea ABC transporter permease subunit UrtB [Geminicoccaceae bacterium]MDW8123382.1 urea ABC transporter permease subunit UrtB [Geminicoccaceae bacterium]MDW8341636.1 urea ABC transporter permease subunit UrtB [Geminicoccaceae bacterium]